MCVDRKIILGEPI